MKLSEFSNQVGAAFDGLSSDPTVVIQDSKTKIAYEVKKVTLETHEEGDGSTTLWIEVEEY